MQETILPVRGRFVYSGKQRYIRLTERIPVDGEQFVNCCLILDEQLSIVSRREQGQIDLEKLKETQLEQSEQRQISYIVESIQPPVLFSQSYDKYPQLCDFQIGRQHWGRSQNALKIADNHISRNHTLIQYKNQMLEEQKQSLRKTLNHMISKQVRPSSKWRKLPRCILELIISYAVRKPYYTVQDCGSRRGTFLKDYSKQRLQLSVAEIYQFQQRYYNIQVIDIAVESGQQIYQRIRRFQLFQDEYFYRRNYKKVITSDLELQAIKKMERVYAIYIQVIFVKGGKYQYLIVNAGQNEEYMIGEGQQIDVRGDQESRMYEASRHGCLLFEKNRWALISTDANERVWHRLRAGVEYELDVRYRYRMGLGHVSTLDVQFFNYLS